MATNPTYINFVYNNYINLSSPATYSTKHLLAFDPALSVNHLKQIDAGNSEEYQIRTPLEGKEALIEALRDKKYVRLNCNEYFIPGTPSYRSKNFIHDNLAYGYCDTCQSVSIAGYRIKDHKKQFHHSSVKHSEIIEALTDFGHSEDPYFRAMCFFSPEDKDINLNIPGIIEQLCSYTYPPPRPSTSPTQVRGIDVYHALSTHLKAVENNAATLDKRAFRLLWEHKRIMTRRANAIRLFLGISQANVDALLEVESKCQGIFYCLIDSARRGAGVYKDCRNRLEECARLEFTCLERILLNAKNLDSVN